MAGCVWFGYGLRFQGGLVSVAGGTLDFLEFKIENGEHIAYLSSCDVPFLAWITRADVIEIREVYYDLMLHAEGDIRIKYGSDGPVKDVKAGKITCLLRQNFRQRPI